MKAKIGQWNWWVEHFHPAIAIEVGGNHPADRSAQVKLPALPTFFTSSQRRGDRAGRQSER